jgi:MSHA biogenesis protein MshN
MSLINQMLQDLERRSVGTLTSGVSPQQVRAVPIRKGVHPAWWLVLVLTVALAGVILWFFLRPAPAPVSAPNLALKIASDLSAAPSPVAQTPLTTAEPIQDPVPLENPVASAPQIPAMEATRSVDDTLKPKKKPVSEASQSELPAVSNVPIAKPPISPIMSATNTEVADKTVKLTKEVKELTPQQRAENSYRQASTALQLGHGSEVIPDLEQALQFDPQHAAARQMLVGVLLQAKRTDDAVRKAQDGLALDPTQTGLAMILARLQVEQGDLKAALATLEKNLPNAQDRADYHAFFAALLQRDNRHKDAINQYALAIAKSPQNGVWWMGLGISLQAENRLPEAKEAFGRAKTSNTLTPELLAFVTQKLTQLN